jgi:hypothetical protein
MWPQSQQGTNSGSFHKSFAAVIWKQLLDTVRVWSPVRPMQQGQRFRGAGMLSCAAAPAVLGSMDITGSNMQHAALTVLQHAGTLFAGLHACARAGTMLKQL